MRCHYCKARIDVVIDNDTPNTTFFVVYCPKCHRTGPKRCTMQLAVKAWHEKVDTNGEGNEESRIEQR